jgi:ABC-2 type transport system ATP-binding protein
VSATHARPPAVEIRGLSKLYGRARALDGVDLTVPEGSVFGFLGPNGAGKTTAIRVMVGLLRPSAGAAKIFGLDCWRDSRTIKAEVGYLPGDLRLQPWLDGRGALRIWGLARGRDLRPQGRRLAERFDLDLSVKVRRMSRGIRQKLGLILALAHQPRLLILDEPTVTLDPLMQAEVQKLLREMAAAGHTIFFSSHTLGEVDQLCDRVAMIRDGRIVANESLAALRQRAGHHVVIRWTDPAAAAAAPPEFLHVERQNGVDWNGMLEGPVERLVAWLAGRPFDDLSIGPPDLETLFRRFYEPGGHRP